MYVQQSLKTARAVTKTPEFHHITPILKYLHLLKINERIQYKFLSHIQVSPNLVIYALFFHSHLIVQLAPLLLSP